MDKNIQGLNLIDVIKVVKQLNFMPSKRIKVGVTTDAFEIEPFVLH